MERLKESVTSFEIGGATCSHFAIIGSYASLKLLLTRVRPVRCAGQLLWWWSLDSLAESHQVDPQGRAACETWLNDADGIELTATATVTYGDLREATNSRFGADVTAPVPLESDTLVTLCALDTSEVLTRPQIDRAVLAVEPGGSTWWTDGFGAGPVPTRLPLCSASDRQWHLMDCQAG